MAKLLVPGDDAAVNHPLAARLPAPARVAVAVAALDALALIATAAIGSAYDVSSRLLADGAVINVVAAPTFPLLAALLLRHSRTGRPAARERLAWLFLGLGVLCTATLVVFTYASVGVKHSLPLTSLAVWVEGWLWTSVVPGISVLLLWFPTGEVPGRRWRWAVRCAVLANVLLWLATAFAPGSNGDFTPPVDNPLGWHAGDTALHVVQGLGMVCLVTAFLAALASLATRYRRGDARTRAQLRWLLLALAVIAVTQAAPTPAAAAGVGVAVNVAATVLLPVTLAVALTRAGYALPRILVYGLLSTLLLTGYVALVALAEAVFGTGADPTAALVAAAVVAVAAAPLRARLQRGVDRLVYGGRGDPYAALSDLGHRIAGSPHALLDEVVHAVSDALRAPYAAVVLGGDDVPTAAVGVAGADTVAVPLTLRGMEVGRLVVGTRGAGEPYGRRDLDLLDDLAQHIAVAAHAAMLTRDLQRSRETLVVAREEERRRIRRDLHDGLGPALAGIAFGIDAARNTLSRDPAAADASLAELKAEVQASLADVRRLVYDLRPPALDQLGLVPAMEEYAARLRERSAVDVAVRSPAPLPALPAAVEVAAYRIATEALNNAVRHSRGRRTTVAFVCNDGRLRVEVDDDGVGVPAQRSPSGGGVGLATMAERAAELGGSCVVLPRVGGGTSVVAELPLAVAS